ncbi:hypothetical protein BKA60DRAFT_655744, partial [Fusarium oxysporum]
NFDGSPIQIGWIDSSLKLFSIRKRKNTRPVAFQPGNRESMTAVDAINAIGQAIPFFLIFAMKSLLEEYVFADIDEDVILTDTETGFNNSQRALQWLQHFTIYTF